MTSVLQVVQVTSGIFLVISILLQQRGTGLGGAFGGEGMSYRSRRGMEKVLLRATVLFAAIFLVTVLSQLFI